MEEPTECVVENHKSSLNEMGILTELNSEDISPVKNSKNTEFDDDSSEDDAPPMQKIRKRVQQFSDSDTEKENLQTNDSDKKANNVLSDSDSEAERRINLSKKSFKSRIRLGGSDSDSDASKEHESVKNEEQQMRMKNKRNKMQQKFKGLLNSRSKNTASVNESEKHSSEDNNSENSGSEGSDNEMSSIAKIKQKIQKSIAGISSVCDPDTSDEESAMNNKLPPKQRQKKSQLKSTKMIEAKPLRMSAKQAMENMQLIKSESNRMLREKAVSLPYHRPKALSLKDIMARRKPAVTSDGKALPIKMNEEQLKQYVKQLEERQKEMMELCKSESDEDTGEAENTPKDTPSTELEETKLDKDTNVETPNNTDEEKQTKNVNEGSNTNGNLQPSESEVIASEETGGITDICNEDTLKTTDGLASETNVDVPKVNDSINSEGSLNDEDLKLVYNDSVEEDNANINNELREHSEPQVQIPNVSSEPESQLISLNYSENNTERMIETNKLVGVSSEASGQQVKVNDCTEQSEVVNVESEQSYEVTETYKQSVGSERTEKSVELNESVEQMDTGEDDKQDDFFSDDDVNMDDIDKIIENAEIMKEVEESIGSPMLIKDPITFNKQPKLTGGPGMVIDLGMDPIITKKSGVELLKERFTYFAKLKTPEELEREREKKLKPGAQHLKLKQALEEQIAEQRSLEWAKRLEEEKQLHDEMDAILDDADEADDSIEKIEAKLDEKEEKEDKQEESDSESEEELLEDDVEIKDKPRKHNPMLDDEAEESDVGENEDDVVEDGPLEDGENDDDGAEDNEESSEEESSESEVEEQTSKPKKGRILKAFEDSDDEDTTNKQDGTENDESVKETEIESVEKITKANDVKPIPSSCEVLSSQDDVIQLAQRLKSGSEDLFTSQESSAVTEGNKDGMGAGDDLLGTQTFSISSAKPADFLCPSQPYHDPNLNSITDGLSQNALNSQVPTQSSQSQPIGEDILALCTGQFYDNVFVSQTDNKTTATLTQEGFIDDDIISNEEHKPVESPIKIVDNVLSQVDKPTAFDDKIAKDSSKIPDDVNKEPTKDGSLLKSILDELDDPEFDKPKPNKFFTGATQKNTQIESSQMKKRLIIDSDDETNDTNLADESKKKKKLKKKKLEQRALQISDDEEEEDEGGYGLDDDEISDIEEDGERVVEYDSEENEIEVKPDKPKKKRKATDFFEQEAELTSEDEWVGSGDEDERDLDRMEREEGDDEVFHQGKLRKELGQIHMRDVLDQDKREVRLLQELLFEDGDLGGGHRQRKFRWRNAGDEESGTVPDNFTDTQEEEFESEEQWRKQRHEREVFLRQMQKQDEEDSNLNVTVNRTTIIKANLSSKSMSTLLMEVNQSKTEVTESPAVPEKKTVKDIPSPKKPFTMFQQNYHGSLLTRGRGALARLAALATPLAADDDAPKIGSLASHKRNFVFATLTQEDEQPKVTTKRKADVNLGTPKLVKKMRIEENNDKLFPYAEENVKDFLANEWESEDVKEAVTALRKLALEDEEKKVDGVVTIPGEDSSKEDQIEGLVKSVKWQMSLDRKVGPLKQLQGLIWNKGYDKGELKGHVYDDVSPALELWRSVEGQKVYIYSSGSVQAQKLLFSKSSAGDLLKFIDGHFDTAVGAKQEATSYTAIAEKIGSKPEEILFLTDIDKEAEAARSAGIQSALVSREGNAPLPETVAASYPVLYSFAELAATNKRKPDAQDVQPEQPAKVLKTDVEADVKTSVETEVKEPQNHVTEPPKEKADEPEKMEVEEEVPAKEEKPADKPTEQVSEKIETTVEEVTDSNDIADMPVCDIEPVIEESTDKTDKKETDKMETESADTAEPVSEPKQNAELKNGDKDSPVPEETPPAVITEIKDITNDKESLNEVAEIIDDLVPVVEEPPAQDMEELQNVGQVLEKECDEILSKVQDVTNLDNIPLKPLLNPIAEETMETENVDSNDIVDRILDTELELEMKQCAEDIALNSVKEISETKPAAEEAKSDKKEVANNEAVATPEVKSTEKIAEDDKKTEAPKVTEESKVSEEPKVVEAGKVSEEQKVSEEKMDESSPTEEKPKASTTEDKATETVEESSTKEPKPEENKIENSDEKAKTVEENLNKMETEVSTPETNDVKTDENKTEKKLDTEEKKVDNEKSETESKETPAEKPAEDTMETDQTVTPVEKKENSTVVSDSVAAEVKSESDAKETQVNGKATNGDADMININGDSSKEDELSSRLSMENGKEVVNGANGDSADAEKAKNESSAEEMKEIADIKVKSVAIDEPRNDPIEQPTEA
ncbi:uncharacterized protein LOC142981239 [Anticarsia gemmatalis]|uniref:uncharacterized protein LOC142981239 n=1 Tax=Anticarsia gemmatalis TaxID=129554 RepID=UPI003F7743E9